ncbi:MAG: hypothetical protein ABEI58_04470 [Candidatus Nanohaloarchaea archaeon]
MGAAGEATTSSTDTSKSSSSPSEPFPVDRDAIRDEIGYAEPFVRTGGAIFRALETGGWGEYYIRDNRQLYDGDVEPGENFEIAYREGRFGVPDEVHYAATREKAYEIMVEEVMGIGSIEEYLDR